MSIFDTLFLTGYNTTAQPTLQGFERAFNQAVYDPNARERQLMSMLQAAADLQRAQQQLELDPRRVAATELQARIAQERFADRNDAEARRRERNRLQAEYARHNTLLGGLVNFAPEAAAGIDPNDLTQITAALGRAPGMRLSRVGREAGARAGAGEQARMRVREAEQQREYLGGGVMTDSLDERRQQLERIRAEGASLPAPERGGRESGIDLKWLASQVLEKPNMSAGANYNPENALAWIDELGPQVRPSQQSGVAALRARVEAAAAQRKAPRRMYP